jgi:hypothetical protein
MSVENYGNYYYVESYKRWKKQNKSSGMRERGGGARRKHA